ncbi:glycoside hydrolase family 43 protein [Chitinophaga japonensis]|uniref:Arabinan endo-1,5-alpha-L-arabinosidase n=1 Tax=Chitinophaga japonensis TaxID=104662 RepID=A0A562T0E8_CHIJA|nr:glycoside hydrolase family 43 protein [Chitinophaga japonensis]TWI87007.1 arabinan endo-1,5-alpha-L-arabinosidase [Chitinophaga japonensis]
MRFIALILVLAGCRSADAPPAANPPADTGIVNPVLDTDFPDPTVIRANGKYYAYATQTRRDGRMLNIQVASSADLQHWTVLGDALPQKPAWASTTQDFWAPHVLYDSTLQQYVMFYSAESDEAETGKCLAVAFADKPEGPFTDKGTPLRCGEHFANIDPMAFTDPASGKKLLYWGSDGEPIRVQEMADDWRSFKPGTMPQPVLWPRQEATYSNLIEGAWVTLHDGKYYLYYSGDNCCGDHPNYAVMIARANQPSGPFTRYGEASGSGSSVILETDSNWLAPGHNSIFTDDEGNEWMAYHAMHPYAKGPRVMCLQRVVYEQGWPVVGKH